MNDIVEFLRARLDEDERVARAAVIPAHDGPNARHPHPALAEWAYRDGGEVEYVGGQHDVPLAGGLMGTSGPIYVTMDHEGLMPAVDEEVGAHIARHDPARVLREVEAKRTALGWYENDDDTVMAATICALAAVYADHPNYDPAWLA